MNNYLHICTHVSKYIKNTCLTTIFHVICYGHWVKIFIAIFSWILLLSICVIIFFLMLCTQLSLKEWIWLLYKVTSLTLAAFEKSSKHRLCMVYQLNENFHIHKFVANNSWPSLFWNHRLSMISDACYSDEYSFCNLHSRDINDIGKLSNFIGICTKTNLLYRIYKQ